MPDELHKQYRRSREHNVAHAQVSTRSEHRSRWLSALAAVLALFSGVAWTKLAGSLLSDQTAELVAASAAFLAAFVSAGVAALHWADADEITDHTSASLRWAIVDGDLEFAFWRAEQGRPFTDKEMKKLEADIAAAKVEPGLTDSELARARKWLQKNRPEVYA